MEVKLQMYLSLIVEAVKAETHIKGRIDKAEDAKLTEVAYHETAGNEQYHERKIVRNIYNSIDSLRSVLSSYTILKDDGYSISSDVDEDEDLITITMNLPKEYNIANNDSLARTCSKYIEDKTIVLWYGALGTFGQPSVQFYSALVQEDILTITKMFESPVPKLSMYPYTTTLDAVGNELEIEKGEKETITYTIDDDVIDDIVIFADRRVFSVKKDVGTKKFYIQGNFVGNYKIALFSKHDELLRVDINVTVTE